MEPIRLLKLSPMEPWLQNLPFVIQQEYLDLPLFGRQIELQNLIPNVKLGKIFQLEQMRKVKGKIAALRSEEKI